MPGVFDYAACTANLSIDWAQDCSICERVAVHTGCPACDKLAVHMTSCVSLPQQLDFAMHCAWVTSTVQRLVLAVSACQPISAQRPSQSNFGGQ